MKVYGPKSAHQPQNWYEITHDARHEKTDLKIFVLIIPKEGLAGWGPANPSLDVTPTTEYNL